MITCADAKAEMLASKARIIQAERNRNRAYRWLLKQWESVILAAAKEGRQEAHSVEILEHIGVFITHEVYEMVKEELLFNGFLVRPGGGSNEFIVGW